MAKKSNVKNTKDTISTPGPEEQVDSAATVAATDDIGAAEQVIAEAIAKGVEPPVPEVSVPAQPANTPDAPFELTPPEAPATIKPDDADDVTIEQIAALLDVLNDDEIDRLVRESAALGRRVADTVDTYNTTAANVASTGINSLPDAMGVLNFELTVGKIGQSVVAMAEGPDKQALTSKLITMQLHLGGLSKSFERLGLL